MKTYIDIGINLTNKQFHNDIETIIQNALDADVSQMILTGTSIRKEVLQYMPLDRMLIETDAPFMLPKNVAKQALTKYHERRNEPAFLPFVAETIAQFKSISINDVAEASSKNAKEFFRI